MISEELLLDYDVEVSEISDFIRTSMRGDLHRRGLVIAISGGIDSSVCAALAVEAIGNEKVFGLLMPETESSEKSTERGEELARHLGIRYEVQNIGQTLKAIGCYAARDDAIRSVFPEYGDGWKSKITISGGIEGGINHFRLVVSDLNGEIHTSALPLNAYLSIVAATNYKQRIRKTIEYFHADRLNYAVIGTPNRLEYDQGFFVKNGDGSADIKPIAHLYKSQVYALAEHLGLPSSICSAVPTTDTYTLEQGQDEFYFALAYQKMDLALYYFNQGRDATELAASIGVSNEVAANVYKDIQTKRATTSYLHLPALIKEKLF